MPSESSVAGASRGDGGVLVSANSVSRSFGNTRALIDAKLEVGSGQIVALAGENGSGKSTLLKVLSGVLAPDGGSGALVWEGAEVHFRNPRAARKTGMATVYQEILVVPELSVRDNVTLGSDGLFRRRHGRAREASEVREALSALGVEGIDVEQPAWSLSLGEQQLLTVARAILLPWKVLFLDESTSALDGTQRDALFAYVRGAVADGRGVVFTSHRMEEVELLATHVCVLRDGETVGMGALETMPREKILALMAGRKPASASAQQTNTVRRASATATRAARGQRGEAARVLEVSDLQLASGAEPISTSVCEGEIVGLAGLEGQGQELFVECLAGLKRAEAGAVRIATEGGSREVRSYVSAHRLGVAYVPRDRKDEGLLLSRSVIENFALGNLDRLTRFGIMRNGVLRRSYDLYAERVQLRAATPRTPIGSLSGGNQQKVLISRWLAMEPRLLVMNDPLRGVDANSKFQFYEIFRDAAQRGLAVVLLSTEIPEPLGLCDRVMVFHDNSVVANAPAEEFTSDLVVAAMFGHRQSTVSDQERGPAVVKELQS